MYMCENGSMSDSFRYSAIFSTRSEAVVCSLSFSRKKMGDVEECVSLFVVCRTTSFVWLHGSSDFLSFL